MAEPSFIPDRRAGLGPRRSIHVDFHTFLVTPIQLRLAAPSIGRCTLISSGWKFAVVAVTAFGSLLAGSAPALAERDKPLSLDFVKVCPQSVCTGVLVREDGQVIPNSSDYFAPTSAHGFPVIQFTAVETVTSSHGILNILSAGTIDCGALPTIVVADGTVTSGHWKGKDLSGSPIHEVGRRVTNEPCSCKPAFSHAFAGTLWVFPESED